MKRLSFVIMAAVLFNSCSNSSSQKGKPASAAAYSFRVPILCYHSVGDRIKGRFSVSENEFKKQMRYLYLNGYSVLPLEKLVKFLEAEKSGRRGIFLPRKPVVITFDDNYPDIQRIAWPILRRYNFPAYNFVYTKFMNKARWQFYRSYHEAGMGFGCHTITHCNLTVRRKGESPQRYRKRVLHELERSRFLISAGLRTDVEFLAYPYGECNQTVVRLARIAGFRAMFSALGGYVTEKSSLDRLPRFTVFRDFDMKMFKLIVSGGWNRKIGGYHAGKQGFRMRDYNFDY